MENAMQLAQLMCVYTILDALCLLNTSLITYCAIKLCLTSTWKVSKNPITGSWEYTSEGIPYRMRRLCLFTTIIPFAIVFDVCYQIIFRSQVTDYYGIPETDDKSKQFSL